MSLKLQVQEDMKNAMRQKEKERLAAIRLILAAIKQREVDERIELDDAQILSVLDKMIKQRQESIVQYQKAERPELVAQEQFEIEVLQTYLPPALSATELNDLIDKAICDAAATAIKDMGKVMALLRPQIQGRADVAAVSAQIKQRLSN